MKQFSNVTHTRMNTLVTQTDRVSARETIEERRTTAVDAALCSSLKRQKTVCLQTFEQRIEY